MTIAITDYAPTVGTTELSIPGAGTYSSGSPQTTLVKVEVMLDLALLASGDAFRLRVYEKATAAGIQRKVAEFVYDGVQDTPGTKFDLGMLGRGWDVTLQKIVGTDRSIPCSLRTDDGLASVAAADIRAAIGMASANLDTQLGDLPTAAENQSGMATAANLATVAGYLDTEIAAILADTNELQTDWANGGRLDTLLDTAAAGGGLDAAAVRAAIGLASANLDAQLDALPTAIENADALLNRNMASVSDTNARTPLNALRFLRNKWSLAGATLTVTKEDDVTPAWTASVTAAPGSDPISGSDPT